MRVGLLELDAKAVGEGQVAGRSLVERLLLDVENRLCSGFGCPGRAVAVRLGVVFDRRSRALGSGVGLLVSAHPTTLPRARDESPTHTRSARIRAPRRARSRVQALGNVEYVDRHS